MTNQKFLKAVNKQTGETIEFDLGDIWIKEAEDIACGCGVDLLFIKEHNTDEVRMEYWLMYYDIYYFHKGEYHEYV